MRRYAVTFPKGDPNARTTIREGATARAVLWDAIYTLHDLGYDGANPATVTVRRLPDLAPEADHA